MSGPQRQQRSWLRLRGLDTLTLCFSGVISLSRNLYMLAVIGNVMVGLLAISLFTATIRLSK